MHVVVLLMRGQGDGERPDLRGLGQLELAIRCGVLRLPQQVGIGPGGGEF